MQRLGTIDQYILSRFVITLIESTASDRVSSAANVTAVRRHCMHRIIFKAIRLIARGRGLHQYTVTVQSIRIAAAREEEAQWLCATRRPRVRRLPLVQAHRVVTNARHLFEDAVVLALEKVIEPRVRQFIVIQTCIANTPLTDDRVLRSAFETTVQRRRDYGVLLIRDLGRRSPANVIK